MMAAVATNNYPATAWRGLIAAALWMLMNTGVTVASPDAERLYADLMRDHNKLIRPVPHNTGILTVAMGLRFIQLIGVVRVEL